MSMMESDDQGEMQSGGGGGNSGMPDNLGQNPMIAATAMICITAIIVAVILGILL